MDSYLQPYKPLLEKMCALNQQIYPLANYSGRRPQLPGRYRQGADFYFPESLGPDD